MATDRRREPAPAVSVIIPTVSQASHLAACLSFLQHAHARASNPPDVLVVLNGASPAVRAVACGASGIRIVESRINRGFAGGCHLGVRASASPFVAFLNDDVRVSEGWLDPLLATMTERPRAGAVGPRVLGGDGLVQEVGSVIWRDGTTRPLGRGEPPSSLAWRWRRRVDYCSACALLVRRTSWDEVGGFDEDFHPAYYEDVDFCLALEAAGHEVWVDPRSDVTHAESASSSPHFKQFLFERHHARLVERRGPLLASRLPPPATPGLVAAAEAAAVSRLERPGPRVLVLDDRVPRHGLRSGFDRMADTLHGLASAGARVRLLPTEVQAEFVPALAAAGIAVIDGCADEVLEAEVRASDVVIVSRPNNAQRACALFARLAPAERPRLIYDAEALYHRRLLRQATLADGETSRVLQAQAASWLEAETNIATCADGIVCVSRDEAAFFEACGASHVRVLTPWLRGARPTASSLAGRADIGFVAGWLAGAGSPNADALEWFATTVLPLVVSAVPWARVRVTGTLPSPLHRLEGVHLRAEGFVPDLAEFYGQLRVAVAPLRFGAGVKLKTLEALQYGVPVVATTVGAEGLEGLAAEAVVVHDDPVAFAAAVVARLRDVEVWRAHRSAIDAAMATVPPAEDWGALLAEMTMEGVGVRRPRYSREIDLGDLENVHTFAVLAVLPGSRVLDLGAGEGSVARALRARGCDVTAVERDDEGVALLTATGVRTLHADLATLDEHALPSGGFDVVLLLDVLEHLVDPGALLARVRSWLAPGGRVLISVPNVAHAAVRLSLLQGRFPRTDVGLLDRTHLHFFDQQQLQSLLAGAGLCALDLLTVERGIDETELPLAIEDAPPAVLEAIASDPLSRVYQFFVVATPGQREVEGGGLIQAVLARLRSAQSAYRTLEDYAAHLQRDGRTREDAVATALGAMTERVTHLETQVRDHAAHAAALVAERDERLGREEALTAELRTVAEYVAHLEAQVREHAAHAAALVADRDERLGREASQAGAARAARDEVATMTARVADVIADRDTLRRQLGERMAELTESSETAAVLMRDLHVQREFAAVLAAQVPRIAASGGEAQLLDQLDRFQAVAPTPAAAAALAGEAAEFRRLQGTVAFRTLARLDAWSRRLPRLRALLSRMARRLAGAPR